MHSKKHYAFFFLFFPKNSQRGIFSSQKILGVKCGHWTDSSCLAAPLWCDLERTHHINCAIQDIPPLPPDLLLGAQISPRYWKSIFHYSSAFQCSEMQYFSERELQGDFYGLVTEAQITFCVILPVLPSWIGTIAFANTPPVHSHFRGLPQLGSTPDLCKVNEEKITFVFYLTNARGRDALKQWDCLFFQ